MYCIICYHLGFIIDSKKTDTRAAPQHHHFKYNATVTAGQDTSTRVSGPSTRGRHDTIELCESAPPLLRPRAVARASLREPLSTRNVNELDHAVFAANDLMTSNTRDERKEREPNRRHQGVWAQHTIFCRPPPFCASLDLGMLLSWRAP